MVLSSVPSTTSSDGSGLWSRLPGGKLSTRHTIPAALVAPFAW
jgi:hypothetical protein